MMMGGGTPPHLSQGQQQQQPMVQAQVPQQTQPQALLQLQQVCMSVFVGGGGVYL